MHVCCGECDKGILNVGVLSMTCRASSFGTKQRKDAPSSLQLEFIALGVGLRFLELSDADQVGPLPFKLLIKAQREALTGLRLNFTLHFALLVFSDWCGVGGSGGVIHSLEGLCQGFLFEE